MIYSIENESLKISANSKGAELYSVYSKKTGTEYLWQGDPAFWTGRAYNLFPFIGRNYEGKFRYDGETYDSRSHGLARYFEFTLEKRTENSLVFLFKDSEETHKEYPFRFEFRVIFTLQGSSLETRYEVTNTDARTLICSFGGHPGINVPFGKGEFEDYYLAFKRLGEVREHLLDIPAPYMADETRAYPLVDGYKLPLRHDLFSFDAVILENTGGEVLLKSDKEECYVSFTYNDYKFIGFWHINKDGAPYVCLEPWSALPASNGKTVDLETKPYTTHVPAGEKATKSFTLTLHE